MPNPIVDLVEKELGLFAEARTTYPDLIPPDDETRTLHPLPFFGDIRSAEVLTLALNPAWNEFTRARGWISKLDARALTTRALHYFDLPEPSPHKFFDRLLPARLQLGRSFRRGVAHVDILSWPTHFPGGMNDPQRQHFEILADSAAPRLQGVLDLCSAAKVIFLLNLTVNDGQGAQWTVWEKAVEHVPLFQNHAGNNGQTLPILRVNGPDELVTVVAERRDEIHDYLKNGPRLPHANYG